MAYNSQKQVTLYFAIIFALLGIVALIPGLYTNTPDGQLLFGLVLVNPAQTVIHFLTAIVAVAAYFGGKYYDSLYLKVFGVVYALVAIWGLPGLTGTYDGVLLGLIHVNWATEVYHILIAIVALYFGFKPAKANN